MSACLAFTCCRGDLVIPCLRMTTYGQRRQAFISMWQPRSWISKIEKWDQHDTVCDALVPNQW